MPRLWTGFRDPPGVRSNRFPDIRVDEPVHVPVHCTQRVRTSVLVSFSSPSSPYTHIYSLSYTSRRVWQRSPMPTSYFQASLLSAFTLHIISFCYCCGPLCETPVPLSAFHRTLPNLTMSSNLPVPSFACAARTTRGSRSSTPRTCWWAATLAS